MRLINSAFTLLVLLSLTARTSFAQGGWQKIDVGTVLHGDMIPISDVPVLVTDVASVGPNLHDMNPELRRHWTMLLNVNVPSGSTYEQLDEQLQTLADWSVRLGSLSGLGLAFNGADAKAIAHALEQFKTHLNGQITGTIVFRADSAAQIVAVEAAGAKSYFDAVVIDADQVLSTAQWFEKNDPGKLIYAIVPGRSANTAFDLAQALANGADVAFLADTAYVNGLADISDYAALSCFHSALAGDFEIDISNAVVAVDATGTAVDSPILAFKRRSDGRLVVVPRDSVSGLSIASRTYLQTTAIDADGPRNVLGNERDDAFTVLLLQVRPPFIVAFDVVTNRHRAVR